MTWETLRRLLTYLEKYRHLVWGTALCAVLSVGANLIGPLWIGAAIDQMIGRGAVRFDIIAGLLIRLGAVYAAGSLFAWLLTVFTNRIAYQTVNDLRRRLFEKLNALPLRFYDTRPHGDTISRFVNDLDIVAEGLLQGLSTLATGIATILGAIGFMVYLNPLMAAVVLLSAPASYLVARFITRRSQQLFKEQAQSLGELNGFAEEMISGQKVVKAFNYERRAQERFAAINAELYRSGVKSQFYGSLANPTTRLVNNITYSVVGTIGAAAAVFGRITVGDISSFLIYANLFAKPFNEITGVLTQIQSAGASARRIFEILDLPVERPDDPEALVLTQSRGNIAFDKVDFAYDRERPLITDFNLEVNPGSRIAIVGRTGAGKTTLVNLLLRFYEVDRGVITVDGVNINRITRDSLRRNFGMVLQDTWLFEGSIRDNIAYGKPEASDAEVIAAAKAADAHGFIKRLPDGYQTLISETGDNLSQGQKQLLTIARVMLADPPLLILDEATSSIDTRTELRIQKAFLRMVARRTSFIIAHRLSTIREADLILVMDHGNVVERGTHQQLLARGGLYAAIYNSQFAPG